MDFTVGDLARRSGLTVRTLHHYEQLGLLIPSGRTEAGYRLYAEADVQRLHRILAYRQMGLALKEIGPLLAPEQAPPLLELLERQIHTVQAQITEQQRVLVTLERVARRARRARDHGDRLTDDLLELMQLQRLLERHYSAAEIDQFRALQDALSPDDLAHIKAEVLALIPAMRQAQQAGEAVETPAVQALARRWVAVGDKMNPGGDDPDRQAKARALMAQEPELGRISGLDAPLVAYIEAAITLAKAGRAAA